MKNKLSELQKSKINHATTTLVVGILFIFSIVKGMYILAVIFFVLFIIGVLSYKSI